MCKCGKCCIFMLCVKCVALCSKISALRLELAKVRRRREESEQRIRLEVYETSDMKKSLEELKEDTKVDY